MRSGSTAMAGPLARGFTDNWNLSDADVDGDDSLDYRMPPAWEYGNPNGDRWLPKANELLRSLGAK